MGASLENEGDEMQRRRITLPDGRYLIFYNFADEGRASAEAVEEKDARAEPAPQSEATGEPRV